MRCLLFGTYGFLVETIFVEVDVKDTKESVDE